MTLRDEQEKIQKAMNEALSGLQGDPWLAQRVLKNVKGDTKMKKRLSVSAAIVIALLSVSILALAASDWVGIGEFLGKIVGGWTVNEQAIVQPLKQKYSGALLDLTVTEAYWAEDGLSIVVRADAKSDGQLPFYSFEDGLLDEEGDITDYIEINGKKMKLDDWRQGRDMIRCEVRPGGEGWSWYKRTDEGLFLVVTEWNVDADAMKKGALLEFGYSCENMQTGETDYGVLNVKLPPMTMQQGHK